MTERFSHRLADDLATDLAADGDIDVTSWTDLAGLPDEMDVLAGQLTSLTCYARRWVCQRDGFEPSPVCLLRPLGELMDMLSGCFLDLEHLGLEDWAELRAGVVDTTTDLKAVDEWAADQLPVVA